jgi:hypothetical protein
MTNRERILRAVVATIQGLPGVQAANIGRTRVDPFNSNRLPGVTIEPGPEQIDATNLAFIDHKLSVIVKVVVCGDVPDSIADPIIESLEQKMMADQTLGGLAIQVFPKGITPEFIEGDRPIGEFSYEFEINYRTLS